MRGNLGGSASSPSIVGLAAGRRAEQRIAARGLEGLAATRSRAFPRAARACAVLPRGRRTSDASARLAANGVHALAITVFVVDGAAATGTRLRRREPPSRLAALADRDRGTC